ncbi:MAG TPA: hypothetical protein VIT23_04050 [Terrimicrobiaceae bacterium]
MRITIAAIIFLAALSTVASAADTPHTPARGSPERQSICDGARAYVIKNYATSAKLPQSVVFRIERIEMLGNYCSFEAIPVFKDGSAISPAYIQDIVFNLCLKRTNNQWRVIYDLSRTDVPDNAELRQISQAFPKEFPLALLPTFWRDLFRGFE